MCTKKIVNISKRIYVALALLSIVSIKIDYIGRATILRSMQEGCPCLQGLAKPLCIIMPDNIEKILDAYNIIWGIAVTIMIFVLEFAQNYVYGVSLKRIAVLVFGRGFLITAGITYLLLYPAIYLFFNLGYKVCVFWCWILTYLGLFIVLVFTYFLTRSKIVRKIFGEITKKELEKELDHYGREEIEKDDGYCSIKSQIDNFSITNMIQHIEYDNAEETRNLSNILQDAITSREKSKGYVGEHTVLMTWVARIVQKIGIETEYQKEQIIIFLEELWQGIVNGLNDSDKDKYVICYTVQILLPFIARNDENSVQIMVRIWKAMGAYGKRALIYMLLYTEFRYWSTNNEFNSWVLNQDPDLQKNLANVICGNFDWNEEIALELWIDWSQYNQIRNDIGMLQFHNFVTMTNYILKGEKKYQRVQLVYILNFLIILMDSDEK